MGTIQPLRDGSTITPLNSRAEANLRFIRETMERASSFTAVPGAGLVLMGLTAIAAASLAQLQPTHFRGFCVWLLEAGIAIPFAFGAMGRKARQLGTSLRSASGRKFLLSFLPPVFAGAILSVFLEQGGHWGLIPGCWLLTYGAGVMAAGTHSVPSVPVMGGAFMALGALAFLTPVALGNLWMGLGFGVMHLGFGIVIARRHGG